MSRHVVTSTEANLDAAWQFYVDVCEHQALDAHGPLWTLGVYPAKQDIVNHIEAGDLFLLFDADEIVGAMALTSHEDDEYLDIPWPSGITGDDVCALHLLAVHPNHRGQGIGSELAQEAIRLARTWGKRAIHLDVVPGNLAASRIYLAAGFSLVGTFQIWYEDTGTMDFELYELVL